VRGLPKNAKPDLEKVFGSGDRADVAFTMADKIIVVEVKSKISDDPDLCRGIFQCIKYWALIRAHQKLKRVVPNGEAILAIGKAAPTNVLVLADALSVTCFDGIGVEERMPKTTQRSSGAVTGQVA
jgi:hypothetical protein